jgi:hypothetical protein
MPTMRTGVSLLRAVPALLLLASFLLAAPAWAQPCCGPITPDGQRPTALLDRSDVQHLWLAHTHVDWRTGAQDASRPGWSATATHCSAYAAAMADRMGIYLLHPPAHGQDLLASAQFRWLTDRGAATGWRPVDAKQAQSLANQGFFVVGAYENPDPHRPGHIAVIRPSLKSTAALQTEGPEEAQASAHNALRISVALGFADHRGAWEPDGTGGIRFFAHPIDWAALPR